MRDQRRFLVLMFAATVGGCSANRAAPSANSSPVVVVPESTEAGSLLARYRQQFQVSPAVLPQRMNGHASALALQPQAALLPSGADSIGRMGSVLVPQLGGGTQAVASQAARVGLPTHADLGLQITDVASGLSATARLAGAAHVPAQVANGYTIYPAAHESGADVLHRPLASGVEDFLAFQKQPSKEEISYVVELGKTVAGLRLVANSLELLDKNGAPRLRISPPYLVGANGKTWPASIALGGCAADTNPVAPWNRAVTSPGADHCVVTIGWNSQQISYPALLDPRWTSTANTMNANRAEHSATLLNNGTVLVVGGLDPSVSITNTADIYDPGSNTFAAAASMVNARFRHTATLLPNGDVLVVGGEGAGAYVQKTERFNGTTWLQTDADPPQGLSLHSASLISSGAQAGKVLIAGGASGPLVNDASLTQVLLFDPAGAGPGTFTPVASLPVALEAHSQVSESGGSRVVIAGGFSRTEPGPVDTYVTTTLVYDANNDGAGWVSAGDTGIARGSSDGGPPMVVLSGSGKVLIMGGNSQSTQLYTFGVVGWASAGTTNFTHAFGAAAQLSNGGVLLTGGDNDNVAELWDPNTQQWTQTDNLLGHRGDHTATTIGATVLLTGGTAFGGSTTNTAELYTPTATGSACVANGECTTGFCVGGVCCSSACALANASSSCGGGTCALGSCNAGFGNCDGNAANGCETGTQSDVNNCGGCNQVCSSNHVPSPSCAGGSCNGACAPLFGDCNSNELSDGCETPLNTLTNCGGCGVNCNDGNPCTNDLCAVTGNTAACVHVPVTACGTACTSAVACGWTDTDGDGLNDTWETNGYIDNNCNGVNDAGDTPLPDPGYIDVNCNGVQDGGDTVAPHSNVNRPNVYVKWDYMDNGDHKLRPTANAMAKVVAAYCKHNTTLTYFPSSDALPEHQVLSLEAAGNVPACAGPDAESFYSVKAAHFPANLQPAYHYGIFAYYNTCDSDADCATCAPTAKSGTAPIFGRTGISEIPGNDFIVSLGQIIDDGLGISDNANAGTFMHELGHNLGLRHGGSDDINNKPNFISVMNYSYQFGIGDTGGTGPYNTSTNDPSVSYRIDYSSFTGGTLQEGVDTGGVCGDDGSGGMNETLGVTGSLASDKDVVVFYSNADGVSAFAPSNGSPIAWDGLPPATKTSVFDDVNGDGLCTPLPGFNDWAQTTPSMGVTQNTNQALGFQCNSGPWADGRAIASEVEDREATGKYFVAQHALNPWLPVTVTVQPACGTTHWIELGDAGTVAVAALGSVTFNASLVDPTSLRFAGTTATSTAIADVNADGISDFVAYFPMSLLDLTASSTQATLVGALKDSTGFGGTGAVTIFADGSGGHCPGTNCVASGVPQANAYSHGECTGTVSNASIAGNVDVPAGASCVFIDVAVSGNVTVDANSSLTIEGGSVAGNITAASAAKLIVGVDACGGGSKISGNLQPTSTAVVSVSGATISGNVQPSRGGSVRIFGSTVRGNLQVQLDKGPTTVGGCTISGNVVLEQNTGSDSVTVCTVSGNLQVEQNTGGVSTVGTCSVSGNLQVLQNSGGAAVVGNTVRGNIQCQSNSPVATGQCHG